MLPGLEPSDLQAQKEKDERRKKIIIALLFLLLSFSCIFCSSQSALWLINRDRIEANMRSNLRADYGFDPALALAPLSEHIITEAEQDEAALLAKQTPIAVGLGVVVLPNPIPTPAPTLIALLPTPTPTPTISAPPNPAPATPVAQTATSAPPTSVPPPSTSAPPASPPPTSLPPTAPPTVSPPTLPPPTVPPTVSPPTVPPPTIPPPTVPPATPPTVPPPTVPPTATATATNTAPTATPIPPTATPIPPTVAFSAATYSVNENGGNAVITVVLDAASSQTVTVSYAAAGGTATTGSDYNPSSGLLTFTPGQVSQTFNVAIINDTIASEGNETILLGLSGPTNATLGLSSATLTIIDDDTPPTVQFSQATYGIGEAGGSVSIDVTLSAASAVTITVNYATSGSTATPGADYQDTSGTLAFAPGQVSQTFNVIINDDALDEADETVDLSLSTPVNATLGTSTAVLTITDDDASPTIQFSNNSYTVGEADGTASIDVTLSTASGLTVTVDFATSDLTATAGSDYTATNGTLIFAPGQVSQSFLVTIIDEIPALDEPDETVGLALSNPNGATSGTPLNATLTIVDDDTPGTCSGIYPNGEPNIGPPNGTFARIACNVGMIIDLGGTPVNRSGDGNFDLAYYETRANPPQTPPEQIFMDHVIVEVGQSPGGPWYQVFNWGDGGPDANTSVGQAGYATEGDNLLIPMTTPPLYGTAPFITGIAIDVDSPLNAAGAPPGPYQYIRIYSPASGNNDGPEVDAIEALP